MAAVLVLAAGGEIRVPLAMIRGADFIKLRQDDSEPGFVIYRATPFDRAGGAIVDAAPAVVEGECRRLPDKTGEG